MNSIKVSEARPPDVSAVKDKLGELIRHASVSRLKNHADTLAVETREMDSGFTPGRILASNMVFILVSGDAVRLTLKVHFNTRTAKKLAFRIFGGKSAADISEKQAIDYFKEYGNLVAGSVIAHFGNIGIELGISLPLCTRGLYEVFSDYSETQYPVVTYSDFWELAANDYSIFCSALIEILDAGQLGKLVDYEIDDEVVDDGEEMDFL